MRPSAVSAYDRTELPVEVLRHIFELAAEDCKQTACRLARVCKEARLWVDPIIYRSAHLIHARKTEAFTRTLRSNTQTDRRFFAKYVKELTLDAFMSTKEAKVIISKCTGVEELSLRRGMGMLSEAEHTTILAMQQAFAKSAWRPKRLHINGINIVHLTSLLSEVTHLVWEITPGTRSPCCDAPDGMQPLSTLCPLLTHVLFPVTIFDMADPASEKSVEGFPPKFCNLLLESEAPKSLQTVVLCAYPYLFNCYEPWVYRDMKGVDDERCMVIEPELDEKGAFPPPSTGDGDLDLINWRRHELPAFWEEIWEYADEVLAEKRAEAEQKGDEKSKD